MLVAPSMLSSDFARLGEEILRVDRSGADWVHLDVMDGAFVPNITFGAPVVAAMRPYTRLPFDVHLMITDPARYAPGFIRAGADIVSFHIEAQGDPANTISVIREAGARPAIVLKPATPVEAVYPFLDRVDMVLVMTVEPGFGGQRFRPEMLEKVRALAERGVLVQVDGGIDAETAALAAGAGAGVCVAGTSVFGAPDMARAVRALRESGMEARGC